LIEIKTNELRNGMVVDFTKLKEIIDRLDHKNLNELLEFEPTAENIVHWIWLAINTLNDNETTRMWLVKVTLWEADKASITYEV
jgi:6-pyruvoyltetrahydropterin/6-carboxytetrahydropterin synthase